MPTKPGPMTPDNKVDEAVTETFPASDPAATTATSGSRAVPANEMMGNGAEPAGGTVTLRRQFPNAESAKLALEGLVREGPLDRRAVELSHDSQPTLLLHVSPADAKRMQELLDRA